VKTEVLSMKLPLHEATLVRRQAAEHGLSKSSYGANLVMRGLEAESADRLPALIDQLNQIVGQFDQLVQRVNRLEGAHAARPVATNRDEQRAFMIETLLLLRFLVKDDLRLKGEIGRKLQKVVGDVRVEGT
jgi:hypothetical protein